eukprot:GFUD01112568.1.p2 GENE.GFUD01112568.1~~GFUD01112568.1.p2  ORF type:complete len:132 (-),score=43.82 GFUD01112568.1:23-418(-)
MVQARIRYEEGSYTGEVNDAKVPEGDGVFEYRGDDDDGRLCYDGEWKNKAAAGYGVMKWQNGDRFEGAWVGGVKEGTGHFTYASGDVFTGPYVAGNRHGLGELVKEDGEVRNENYKEGKLVNFTITKEKAV